MPTETRATLALWAVLCMGLPGLAVAADIYVSPSGHGTSCTSAAPCHVDAGMSQLRAGATLWLAGGTYLPGIINLPSGHAGTPWRIRNVPGQVARIGDGHTRGHRLQSRAYAPLHGIIAGDFVPGRSEPRGIVLHGAAIDSRGEYLTVQHVRITGGTGTQAIAVGSHSQLLNLEVDHNGFRADGSRSTLNHGIYTHASHLVIDGGAWHHNSGYAMHLQNSKASTGGSCTPGEDTLQHPDGCGGVNVTVRNTRVYANGHGILMRRGRNSTVINNLVYANGARGIWIESPGSLVAHNTVVGNNASNGSHSPGNCQVGNSHAVRYLNNIVVNSVHGRPPFCADGGVMHLSQAGMPGNYAGNGINPKFVNERAGDFRLQADSPARDAGAGGAGVSRDFVGASRPVGARVDIGAYEFGGQSTCGSGACDPPLPDPEPWPDEPSPDADPPPTPTEPSASLPPPWKLRLIVR